MRTILRFLSPSGIHPTKAVQNVSHRTYKNDWGRKKMRKNKHRKNVFDDGNENRCLTPLFQNKGFLLTKKKVNITSDITPYTDSGHKR